MRAVSCVQGTLSVVDLVAPVPAASQLLLDVLRCGICGSDLHAKDHAGELLDAMAAVGYPDFMRSDTPTVLGHEFCGEIAERGRGAVRVFPPAEGPWRRGVVRTSSSIPRRTRPTRCPPPRRAS